MVRMRLPPLGCLALVVALGILPAASEAQAPDTSARALAGLWHAKLRFGPDVRGSLTVEHEAGAWRAEIAGRSATARLLGDTLSFELPDGRGGFRGRLTPRRERIVGHWIQPVTVSSGASYASPVILARVGPAERWRGEVEPLDDQFTMYLKVEPSADGSVRAFLKNPERNLGRFTRIAALEREADSVRLLGAGTGGARGSVLARGVLRDGMMSVPLRGGTYDFRRVEANAASDFYPRSRPGAGAEYRYRVPTALDDGWSVDTPEAVGMSRAALERLVRMIIDTPIDSINSPEVHGLLVARHGRLILEEYFHGHHRDQPHDTRSAAKSLTATLLGAAIQAGVPLNAQTPVYQAMNGGRFPEGLEPRKRALALEHLLTMSSGLDLDDSDPDSKGREDTVAEQTDEPDWWKLTLGLPMVRSPGDSAAYASMSPHLVGGVLRRATGRPLPELFHELIAEPLAIRRYWMNLTPTGEAYMGGGVRLVLRDFMKMGQLMMSGGTWNGRRVVSEAWARRSTSPLVTIGTSQYGYLWWLTEYPFQGRKVKVFYAGGNGGQVVIGIPELDLMVAANGGNYNDRVLFRTQRVLVPEHVLPAVVGK